jgi:hypothetical protein
MKIAERILELDTRIKHVAVVEIREPYQVSEDFSQPRYRATLSKDELSEFHKTDVPLLISLVNKYVKATGSPIYGIVHYEKFDTIFCKYGSAKVVIIRTETNQGIKVVDLVMQEIGRG